MDSKAVPASSTGRRRGTSVSSVAQSVVAATERVLDTDLPVGFLAATAEATSQAPTIDEIRRGSLGQSDSVRRGRSQSNTSRRVVRLSRTSRDGPGGSGHDDGMRYDHQADLEPFPPLVEEQTRASNIETQTVITQTDKGVGGGPAYIAESHKDLRPIVHGSRVYTSGYVPPPRVPWTTSTAKAMQGFGRWVLTPFGFLITLYGLNVVAWGGMLFLLLCNASPAMCYVRDRDGNIFKDCNDINSPRRIWVEIDSQILNALFCVTGFGLAPWRFRDLYYLLRYRLTSKKRGVEKKLFGLRKLAGHYRTWIRLPGSTTLDELSCEEYLRLSSNVGVSDAEAERTVASDVRIPLPISRSTGEPLTGVRAPETKTWKVDFFVWMQVWNTFFQVCLCVFMWKFNRFNRPSWATGLFVALACGVAGAGGVMSYIEGRKVKRVEGVQTPPAAPGEALSLEPTISSEDAKATMPGKKIGSV